MTRLALSAALVAALFASACKPESARRADRAARDLIEERDDVVKAAKQIGDKPLGEVSANIAAETGKLARAAHEFEKQKSRRLAALHAILDVDASQAGIIGVLARDMPITDAARGDVNDKLTRFHMRLDEVQNLIEGLTTVAVDNWEQRNGECTDAMKRLANARSDAWEALEDAPQLDRSAS